MATAFSGALSALRREKKLNQRKVAEDLGVSQALLSHYENGLREPRLDFVAKVCDYYDVSADYLLGRTDEPNPTRQIADSMRGVFDELKELSTKANTILEDVIK